MFNIPQMRVLFWFRRKISEAKSENPSGFVQVRITYDGDRCELGSTHIQCLDSQWDREKKAFAGHSLWAKEQNEKLRIIMRKVEDVYRQLQLEGSEINADLIKERCLSGDVVVTIVDVVVNGRTVKKRVTKRKVFCFDDLHQQYIELQERKAKRKKISEGTVRKKKNLAKNINEFLASCQKAGVPATTFRDEDLEDLTDYLLDVKAYQYPHVEKHLQYWKEVMRWSDNKGLIRNNPIADYRIESASDIPDTTHLPLAELKKLIAFDFNSLVKSKKIKPVTVVALARERDAFVFNCFTGMHHIDYISKQYTIEEVDGEFWLTGERIKTGSSFNLKLLEPAVAIFRKYGADLAGLPTKSNTGRNGHLHLISAYCELSVDLTTKIARKTFADMALNELMLDANDVAALLGLNSTRQLRHYARPRRSRLRQLLSSWDQITSRLA